MPPLDCRSAAVPGPEADILLFEIDWRDRLSRTPSSYVLAASDIG